MFDNEFSTSKPALARAIGVLFGGALVFLSAITSAAFFYEYAPAAFDFLSPTLSPWFSALVGVLCFEGASVAWSWLRAHDADTGVQLAVANVGAWGAMLGGLLVTAVFFSLNSSLISERLDATAEMTVSLMGGLLIILGIGANFALGFVYRNGSAGHTEASNTAELRAMQTAAKHTINRESTGALLSRTVEEIRRTLPQHAKAKGQLDAGQYMTEKFTTAPANQADNDHQGQGIGFHLIKPTTPARLTDAELLAWLRANPDFFDKGKGK